jgi:hypothetical protein
MRRPLRYFDSRLNAVLFILVGLIAIGFLGMGIYQVYNHFSPMIGFALIIGGATTAGALAIVSYWLYRLVKK